MQLNVSILHGNNNSPGSYNWITFGGTDGDNNFKSAYSTIKVFSNKNVTNNQTEEQTGEQNQTSSQEQTGEQNQTSSQEQTGNQNQTSNQGQNQTDNSKTDVIAASQAKNSIFKDCTSKVNKIKRYYYTNKQNSDYTLMDVEVSGISKATDNDKLEYYYYISSNENEKNIEKWIKIPETQNYNNKLQFQINSKDIVNYSELVNSDAIYLYVREVATKGEGKSTIISDAIKLNANTNVEVYENDKIKVEDKNANTMEGSSNVTNKTNEENLNTNIKENTIKDSTTATVKLPQTGVKITVGVAILTVLALGIYIYIRYKKLSKIIK